MMGLKLLYFFNGKIQESTERKKRFDYQNKISKIYGLRIVPSVGLQSSNN